jgi:hypothetical protein
VSKSQALEALSDANKMRLAMVDVKHRIFSGDIPPTEIFDIDDNEALGAMRVVTVLSAQRRWSAVRARRFLSRAELFRPPHTVEQVRLRDLTSRERAALKASMVKATNSSS